MEDLADLVFEVDGMMCQKNCATTVQKVLLSLPAVRDARVTFAQREALVWLNTEQYSTNPVVLIESMEAVGYDAVLKADNRKSPADLVFEVDGMMCQKNCATTVQKVLLSLPAVRDAKVTFAEREALVWLRTEKYATSPAVLIQAMEAVGYDAVIKADNRQLFPTTDDAQTLNPMAPTKPDISISIENIANKDIAKIESLVRTLPGVLDVAINDASKELEIWGYIDKSLVVDTIKQQGFGPNNRNANKEIELTPITSTTMIRTTEDDKVIELRAAKIKQLDSTVASLRRIPHLHVEIIDQKVVISFNQQLISSAKVHAFLEDRELTPAIINNTTEEEEVKLKKEFMYSVRGMSCGNCAVKIEKAISTMPGVTFSAVSVMTHQAKVIVDDAIDQACGPRDVMEKVRSLGYECDLMMNDGSNTNHAQEQGAELTQWRRLLIISIIFGGPVVVLHLLMHYNAMLMMFMMQPAICGNGVELGQLVMFLLNSIMLIFVGYKFYRAALISAYHGSFGMDFLVMTGTSITFLYSTIQLCFACKSGISTEHMFFETTGMLLLFVTIGKYIECYATGKSASSVAELLKLQAREAFLVTNPSAQRIVNPEETDPMVSDDDLQVISVDLVQKGDIVKVLPGGRIPTDGRIVLGSTYVDESMITGESNPVHKTRGDEVFGSTVNQDNCVYITVTSYGQDSALAQIVKLVESAQMSKAPVQQYADRLAGIFTPIILILAVLTFTVWLTLSYARVVPRSWFEDEYDNPLLFSLLFAISVVVISCPCALGLATPTAIMVGTTVGAANGILIKGGHAFEIAHKVDTIVFDKTGTLTEGKPSLTDEIVIENKGKYAADSMLVLAATAEQRSEHPIAQAIIRAAKSRGINPLPLAEDASISFVGSGVSCESALGKILIGNRGFMKAQEVTVSAIADSAMWNLEIQGKTAICVALNGQVFGVLGLSDVPKPEADTAVRTLKSMGIDVWMLTGDNATTAEALAHSLEISQDRVLAGMLPQDKVSKVRELQAAGHCVAMIGDGINDSPALAQADLGVAIGAGTQIAIEAASMVLVRSNLHDLVVSFDLAKVVFRRIRLNFMWAMIYNVIAVPFAAGVWFPWTHVLLPPHYAGLAMALSSISVVMSSMLLTRYRRPPLLGDAQEIANGKQESFWKRAWQRRTTPEADYDQLPTNEKEWEMTLGLGLGLGRMNEGRTQWNSIRDDMV